MIEETYNTDTVECPFCHYKHSDLWEYDLEDGDLQDFECMNCEKTFEVSVYCQWSYTAREKKINIEEKDNIL
jgi:hypothetical protein